MTFNFITFIMILALQPNYILSMDSFEDQFEGVDSLSLRQVGVKGPGGKQIRYLANQIKTINCIGRNDQLAVLSNSPSIEIRFTYKVDNKKKNTVLYFDTVYIQDSLVVGCRSRFMPSLQTRIPLNKILKIEVQDGGKAFYYLE